MRRYKTSSRPAAVSNFQFVLLTDERNREREVVGSHDQKRLVAFDVHIVLGVIGSHETFAGFAVRHLIAGEHDLHAVPAEHLEDVSRVRPT